MEVVWTAFIKWWCFLLVQHFQNTYTKWDFWSRKICLDLWKLCVYFSAYKGQASPDIWARDNGAQMSWHEAKQFVPGEILYDGLRLPGQLVTPRAIAWGYLVTSGHKCGHRHQIRRRWWFWSDTHAQATQESLSSWPYYVLQSEMTSCLTWPRFIPKSTT